MAVTTSCTLVVGIADLRAAITSVVVHASPVRLGDDDLATSRVRILAEKDELILVATNGTTSALAATRILEDSRPERFAADDGTFAVDIHPAKIRDIARQIKPTKDEDDSGACEVILTDLDITTRDASGLWPGTSLTVPLLGFSGDNFPDVRAMVGRALAEASGTFKPLCVPHHTVSLFDVAGKAYDADVVVEPTGTAEQRGFVVLVGDRFIGTVSSRHGDGDSLGRRDRERTTHLTRLGLVPAPVS